MEEKYEELFFAEFVVKEGKKLNLDEENKYAIAHHVYNHGGFFDPGLMEIGLSYQELVGYLKGATIGKVPNKEIFLYNGISHGARMGSFLGVNFYPLSGKDLEDLLLITKLDKKFEGKVRYI